MRETYFCTRVSYVLYSFVVEQAIICRHHIDVRANSDKVDVNEPLITQSLYAKCIRNLTTKSKT